MARWSCGPSFLLSEATSPEIMSSRLEVWCDRNWRAASESPCPNRRRKIWRGLLSTGSGVEALRNDRVPE